MAAFASQLALEFREWTPRWTEMLINRAVRRLPPELQERMSEEWREFVADAPGHLVKLKRALGLSSAATRVASDVTNGSSSEVWPQILTRTLGAAAIMILLPNFLLIVVVLLLRRRGSIFKKAEDGNFYRFRTDGDDGISQLLRMTSMNELPRLWSLVNGDVTLRWPQLKNVASAILNLLRGQKPP